jgi:diguanylate cyclase (GGDEF)-like protein
MNPESHASARSSTHRPRRLRLFAAAAVLLFALELLVAAALWLPGLVPDAQRPSLRTADFVLTWGIAGLLLAVLLHLARSLRALREVQQRQQALFDAMPTGLALWSADGRLQVMNQDFRRLYAPLSDLLHPGVRFDQLMRAAVQRGLVPEAAGHEEQWLAARIAQHLDPGRPLVRLMADGRWRRIVEQRLPDGQVLAHSIDITELEQARAEASLARRRLEDAIEVLPAGFELFDGDDRLLAANSLLKRMYPRIADLLEQPLTWEQLVRANHARGGLPEPQAGFEDWLAQRGAQRRSNGLPRVQMMGDGRWVRTYERSTREGGIVGVRIDVSELMEREQALLQREQELRQLNQQLDRLNADLRRQAETDPLTGVANRRAFDRLLAEAWAAGRPLALLLLDIDHFKRFNDCHGHPAGDAVLRRVAAVLVASLRSPSDVVARIGGEEFAMLLQDTDAVPALATAERSLALLADADIAHGDSPIGPKVTASIGVAHRSALPDDAAPTRLIELADAGLYEAKAAGRNRALAAVRESQAACARE